MVESESPWFQMLGLHTCFLSDRKKNEKKRIMLRSLIKTYYKMNEQACILGEFLDKACSLLQRLATLRQRCWEWGTAFASSKP